MLSPPSQHPVLQLELVAGITEMEERRKQGQTVRKKRFVGGRGAGQTHGKRESD